MEFVNCRRANSARGSSSEITRERLALQPTHVGLLDDLEDGHYFRDLAA